MLFLSMILVTVGYAAIYATLHGDWQFWQYFFPKGTAGTTTSTALAGADVV